MARSYSSLQSPAHTIRNRAKCFQIKCSLHISSTLSGVRQSLQHKSAGIKKGLLCFAAGTQYAISVGAQQQQQHSPIVPAALLRTFLTKICTCSRTVKPFSFSHTPLRYYWRSAQAGQPLTAVLRSRHSYGNVVVIL